MFTPFYLSFLFIVRQIVIHGYNCINVFPPFLLFCQVDYNYIAKHVNTRRRYNEKHSDTNNKPGGGWDEKKMEMVGVVFNTHELRVG